MPKKVLFTTVSGKRCYDYLESNSAKGEGPFWKYERRISYGLRFIKANVPGVEILEYPTWSEFRKALQLGWDAVGFSFYTNEIPVIKRMVAAARRSGVPELWGGNYGVITPEAAELFDRIAVGYSESQIAEWLGVKIESVIHPPLMGQIEMGRGLGLISLGILFTLRGCNRGCTFCQTPAFCGGVLTPLPIESLVDVIKIYQRFRVGAVLILDECFGSLPAHAERVVELLDNAALPWLPMSRVDILMTRLQDWGPRGMAGALIGIESLNDVRLKDIKKGSNADTIRALIRRLHAEDRLVIGFYMIGYEDETQKTLERDLQELAALQLDVTQVCILTPFHKTPLWEHLSTNYGIHDHDLSKFNGKHLVWAHPKLTVEDLDRILQQFFQKTSPPERPTESMRRFGRQLVRRAGISAGLSFLAGSFLRANAAVLSAANSRGPHAQHRISHNDFSLR
jgi:pyruvate-formate lyase-activating enzyme